jgi:hypothetical protein
MHTGTHTHTQYLCISLSLSLSLSLFSLLSSLHSLESHQYSNHQAPYSHEAITFFSNSANRGTIAEYVACRSPSGVAAMLTWGSASAASASRSVWPYGTCRISAAVSTADYKKQGYVGNRAHRHMLSNEASWIRTYSPASSHLRACRARYAAPSGAPPGDDMV